MTLRKICQNGGGIIYHMCSIGALLQLRINKQYKLFAQTFLIVKCKIKSNPLEFNRYE